jgi:hypothetical protein
VEKLLPDEGGGGYQNNNKSISEMRRELLVRYTSAAQILTPIEVEDAWWGYELQRQLEEMADTVCFPTYPASALGANDKWDVLSEFDFAEGAAFQKKSELDEKDIPEVINTTRTKHTNRQKDGAVYSAIPTMFIDYARKCRLDVSYRLLRRCFRTEFCTEQHTVSTTGCVASK